MIKAKYPIEKFSKIETPFYYYDLEVLRKTLEEINIQSKKSDFHVH